MDTKMFEVWDSTTFIPVLAIKLDPRNDAERYLLEADGYIAWSQDYNEDYVLLAKLSGDPRIASEPYDWYDRAMLQAHKYIRKNWDAIESGEVVDVEYILGEVSEPKTTRRTGG